MPTSVERALADALALDHPDAPWTPPTKLPGLGDLRSAMSTLNLECAQATAKHVTWCLAKLMMAFEPNVKSSAEETKLRAAVWLESCGDLGDALWSKATLEAIRSTKWMPKPSEFRAFVATELADRAKKLERCRVMLASASSAAAPKSDAPIREAPIKRLKRILAEQRADPTVSDSDRLFNMANTERALALQERRLMEPWAEQFFDDRVAAEGGRPRNSLGHQASVAVNRSSPTSRRLAEIAAAKHEGREPKPWRADEPVYERGQEEPPPHDDIPEGAAA